MERETEDAAYLRVRDEEAPLTEKEGILAVQSRPLADIAEAARSERDRRVEDPLGRADV